MVFTERSKYLSLPSIHGSSDIVGVASAWRVHRVALVQASVAGLVDQGASVARHGLHALSASHSNDHSHKHRGQHDEADNKANPCTSVVDAGLV